MNVFVQANSYLTLHYRITLNNAEGKAFVFADTFNDRPGTLQMGAGQWAPGMEQALIGRREGERLSFDLTPADAYGERNPELLQRVTRAMLDEHAGADTQFEPGDRVEFQSPKGGRYCGAFKEWGDGWALFDFNHPLAGMSMRVDVAILGVL